MKHSLEGKLALLSVALVAVAIAACGVLVLWFESPTIAVLGALIVAVPIAILVARWFMGPIRRTLEAVSDGIGSMRDRDFSVSTTPSTDVELRALVASYNGLGQLLRDERQSLYQRELLLDTVI
ncbi:MAG: ATP-binding protein, partial [Steroidobacteraceae bacterium]